VPGHDDFSDLASVSSDHPVPRAGPLRLAVAAYLARFKGSSREHTQSDLRSFLTWCAEHDFALVTMLGLLGLRIFEASGADITDLGEEHGHRVLRVCGKGSKVVLVPLPPAVSRAIDRAAGTRTRGPILLYSRGARMDHHAATRRLRYLADVARKND
jgi:integrase